MEEYRNDYNAMLNNFMHGTLGHPDFDYLIERLTCLNQKINSLE